MPFCRFWNFQNTWVCESSEAWWSISNPASTCRQYPHVLDQCKEHTPSGHPYLNHLSGSFDLWMVYLLPWRLTPFKIPFDHPYQSFIYLWSPEDGFFLRNENKQECPKDCCIYKNQKCANIQAEKEQAKKESQMQTTKKQPKPMRCNFPLQSRSGTSRSGTIGVFWFIQMHNLLEQA